MKTPDEPPLPIVSIDATHDGCHGCVLDFNSPRCKQVACLPHERDDGRNVIFIYGATKCPQLHD